MTTTQTPPVGNTAADSNSPPAFSLPEIQANVEGAFTRRCGKRDPIDKSLCMYEYGHKGRHAWERAYISEHWREWGSNMTEKSWPGTGSRGRL
jgi:hypothetical protein